MCLKPRGLEWDVFEHEFMCLNVALPIRVFVYEKECGFVCECLRYCCGREDIVVSVSCCSCRVVGAFKLLLRVRSGGN